ncbi:hypothetical protein TRFO_08167 [Tritrichomonas foetus]|uniref:TOG domain-containing protein n=1 Tax=Tritrichomonas foetus TaxID=1144522 RepID=A0A1J4JL98_9EUKA|nr:hypothetical protein TRFO_08167 [Tritrichomonas foetus]|eukprot:OHS99870.1 hypothetical protein TRFO_08167 [Tritrichomonas foetus]
MKRTPGSASKNRYPTTADLTVQNQQMFEKAGCDIEPIELNDIHAEIKFLSKNIDSHAEWDQQVEAMQHLMGLINGGALNNERFQRELPCIYSGCAAAVTNLRSALVKQSCLLISQLARELGNHFDHMGDFVTPLSTQLSHGTQIISESCKFTILCIASNCPSRKVLTSIIDLSAKKGASSKSVAAEAFSKIASTWNLDAFNMIWPKAESAIVKLCSDASPDARSFARDTVHILTEKHPEKAARLISKLDMRTKKAFEDFEYNLPHEEVQTIQKPTRAASVKRESRLRPPTERRKPSAAPQNPHRAIKNNNYRNDNIRSNNRDTYKPSFDDDLDPNDEVQLNFPDENKGKQSCVPTRSNFQHKIKINQMNDEEIIDDTNIRTNKISKASRPTTANDHATKKPTSTEFTNVRQTKTTSARAERPNNTINRPSRAPSASRAEKAPTSKFDNIKKVSPSSRYSRAPSSSRAESVIRNRRKQDDFQEYGEAIIPDEPPKQHYSARRQSLAPSKSARSSKPVSKNTSPTNKGNYTSHTPSKPKIPKYQLQNGQERSFLAGIRKIIDEGETEELSQNLTDVSLGILKCCVHTSPQIQGAAFALLNDFLPPYYEHFQPSLSKLLALLVHAIESNVPRASSTAQLMLNSLPKYYDCNELINICVKQPPNFPILNLLSSLVSMSEAYLSSDHLCLQILQVAFNFHKNIDMKIRHTTAHIIMRIEQANHSAIKQFIDQLSDKNRESFEEFITPYIPDLTFNQSAFDIPQFDPKAAISFRHKISQIMEEANDKEWIDIRSQVYSELNEAMQSRGQEKGTLNLIKNVLQDRGVSEFHRLLPGLLYLSKGSFSPIVNNIFVIIMKDVDVNEFLSSIVQVTTNHPIISFPAIELITRVFATVTPKELIPTFHIVFPLLQKEFSNESPEIRKSVVMCFVEMKMVDNEAAEQFINMLAKSQKKLISVFYTRRCSQSS